MPRICTRSRSLLKLGDYLLLGRGEEMSGGREKKALLANALEAVIAAVYLDGGFEPARQFVIQHILGAANRPGEEAVQMTDYKSALQEMAQALEAPAAPLLDRRGARARARQDVSGGSAGGARLGQPRRRALQKKRRPKSRAEDAASS